MLKHRFIINKVKYDVILMLVGFGFTKFSFKRTSMTFLFDWTLRIGIIAISKWQSKTFKELKKMSDAAWDEKWKGAGHASDPKLKVRKGSEVIEE